MSKATITFSDQDGAIKADVFYEGGFQKDSHAHQHMQIVLKMMDQIAEPIKEKKAPVIEAPSNVLQIVGG